MSKKKGSKNCPFLNFCLSRIDRFKLVADKDIRKMSNIVENLIRRYVESKIYRVIKLIKNLKLIFF